MFVNLGFLRAFGFNAGAHCDFIAGNYNETHTHIHSVP